MTTLRRLYLSTLRLIGDLERADFVQSSRIKHGSPGGALSKDEKIIARAGTTTLLASVKASMEYAGGDLFKGLVLTAIWSANVKHVTNSSKSATTTILPDYQRRPVSVLAISRSLRLPYETTRRYAKILMDEKICVRAGRKGLIMSEAVHRASTDMTLRGYGIITSLISDLRQAGIRIEKS